MKLYGIGTGPGNPEYLTLKAYRLLKEADVIFFPQKGKGKSSYAFETVAAYLDDVHGQRVGLTFPMTKDKEKLQAAWDEAGDTVRATLKDGQTAVFLVEGEPLLYSTFNHLFKNLQVKVPELEIEIVPGISSVNAAAAELLQPLADGDEHFAIIPATNDEEMLKNAIEQHDCVVFLKAAKAIHSIKKTVDESPRQLKAHAAVFVSTDKQQLYTLEEAVEAKLPYFTLVVVKSCG